jgi:sulfate adenylyltransferase
MDARSGVSISSQLDPAKLIEPYGGQLIDLVVTSSARREELLGLGRSLPSVTLSARSLCDLELLATGAFSPLSRFMGSADYTSVLEHMRLADGRLFPIPITLPIPVDLRVHQHRAVTLRAPQGDVLAVMRVEEVFEWNAEREAEAVLGTLDPAHPLVAEMQQWHPLYCSGPIEVLRLPSHSDFRALRRTPAMVRSELSRLGHPNVVAFQTRNPMHRAHEELTKRACERVGGSLLIHPVVGVTKPGDIDHYTRVRCYQALVNRYYDRDRTLLSLIPLAMRMAGPREAVWHAIIRRNYGANHLIVGRDHASPGRDSGGRPFYDSLAAQKLVKAVEPEVGVKPVLFDEMVYVSEEGRYKERSNVPPTTGVWSISGTDLRTKYLNRGRDLPDWFTRPETAAILRQAYPPKTEGGFCVWLTGLPCAGKSTVAEALVARLMEQGRTVTLLDGDTVRRHLSKGLGFTREDRIAHNERMGFIAAEIVRHHGVVVCAAVSPFEEARVRVRELVGADRFVLVYVDTPLNECERRDVKGMYAQARRGELQRFTGIDDPYEAPVKPEVRIETVGRSVDECVDKLWLWLQAAGFVKDAGPVPDAGAVARAPAEPSAQSQGGVDT